MTATITVTPEFTAGGDTCTGTPLVFTITVNPVPSVDPVADQTVCAGENVPQIDFSGNVPGASFSWTRTPEAIGLPANSGGNFVPAFTAANAGNTPLTSTFTVTASFTGNGLTCVSTPIEFEITVNPVPNVDLVDNQTVCNGDQVSQIDFSGNVPGTVFNWTNNTPSIGLAAAGSNSIPAFTAINNTNAPVTATITVTPEFIAGGDTCTGTPLVFTITVNPVPNVNPVADQTVCASENVPQIDFSGNVPGASFSWTRTPEAIGLPANSGGNFVPAFIATNAGNTPLTSTFTVTASFTGNGLTLLSTPIEFEITVNPVPNVDLVDNQTVCNGDQVSQIDFTGNVPGTVFNWTNNTPSIGLAAAGSNSIPAFTAINNTNAPVTATITVTPEFIAGGDTCTGTPLVFTITVNPTPSVNPVADQTVCAGENVPQIDFSGNVPGASFSWTRTPEAIGLPANSGGNFVPAFTAANAGNTPLTSTFTVTASFTGNGLTCVSTPIEFEITVNPVPNVDLVDNQTVCNGDQVSQIDFTGNVPGTVFNWTNNTPSIGLAAAGSNSIPAFTAINNTNAPVTATITVTPEFIAGGDTCTGTPLVFTITVNPVPNVNPVADQTVCAGENVPQIDFSGNVPGASFSWTRTPEAIGLPANSGGNFVPAFIATNAGNTPLTSTFTVTASFTGNGLTCMSTPIEFEITVNPVPNVDLVDNQTVCNGDQISQIDFSGNVPGTVFNWTNNTPSIGVAAAGSNSIPAFTAINNTNAPVTAIITVISEFIAGGDTCTGTPLVFTITVNPVPGVNPVGNQLLCSGETTTAVNFSGAVPGTVFNWTNSNTGIGLAASGSGNIPAFVTQNAGNTPLVATITVTPEFTNNNVTCTGTPVVFTITVDPRPTVFAGFDQIICQNQDALLVATLGGGATGGSWSGGAGTFSTPNAATTFYTPTPAEYGTTVIFTFTTNDPIGPCPAASDDVAVTINTSPIVFAGNDVMICKDENLDLSKLSASIMANGSGITTGTWSTNGTGTFLPNNAFPPGATTYVPSAADRAAGAVLLTLTSADPVGPCAPVTDQVILSFQPSVALVCNNNVQIALDQSGMEEITPDMILEATYPGGMYTVEVFVNGINVGNKVDCSHIGKNVVVKVTDECTGVFCTTTVTVVDHLAPKVTCTDLYLICAVSNYTPNYLANILGISDALPAVEENCGQYTLSFTTTWHDLTCADDYIGYARRVWTATDAAGNKGTCVQFIYFEQKSIDDLTLPGDVTLECNNGPVNIDPQVTGAPYLTAYGINFPIYPDAGFCRLSAIPSDKKLPSCDGSYDLVRTWTIYDWCKPTTPTLPSTNPKYHIQMIRVVDKTGPVLDCPDDQTVSTNPLDCCANVDLHDLFIRDACSSIRAAVARVEVRHPITGDVLATYEIPATLTTFPGNNPNDPDTLAVFGFTPCLPEGTHTVTYHVEDNCGNTSNCSFDLTVQDLVPPVPACDEITQVVLGIDGMNFTNATTFDDGSYDACSSVYFKARRLEANTCQSNDLLFDQVKFCCEDIGDTILVILRVYDAQPPVGPIPLDFDSGNYNECQVQVYVEDKLKPTCSAPAHLTVSCESFDPSLWAYGMASGTDNCCIDTVETVVNYSLFDTVCNKGTITRTFRVFDCGGQSTTCTQRIVVNYTQNYFIRFPNDWNITECNSGFDNFGKPEFFGEDCELMGVSHQDVLFTVVPDACFKIERTWTIINWCTFDPNMPCMEVPNPNPNVLNDHPSNLVGPTVSPAGTPAPWAPTNVRINPLDQLPTNFSTFWSANANCYKYKQIIKVTDKKAPDIKCPTSPVTVCDQTTNDPQLWNETYWLDNLTGSHNLCEAPVDLCITATDDCSLSDVNVRYLLFLDLDNNGDMETVVNSANPPAPNTVFFGNANDPNFAGGTPRAFDGRPVTPNQKYQFAIQTTVSGDDQVACLRWNTPLNPGDYVLPELPYGTHKIKWIVADGCGNEKICEYTFVVKDCKAPTVQCFNGLSTNLMPTKMISVNFQSFVQDAYDNCTPSNLLIFGIRKANTGTGFPFNSDGTPQTVVNFDCSNLGFNLVEVWAMDLAGNTDFCDTYIHIQDNAGVCGSNNASVAGMLQTESGQGLEDVNISVQVSTGSGQPPVNLVANSDQDGYFLLPNALPSASSATIAPVKDNDPLNGVSTFDLVLINKHILGQQPLSSPYKMIAADANNSRSITTLDILELRKLILGIYTDLPNNTSWRFVDKNYVFPNTLNPFQGIFPETKEIVDPQTHQMYEDFMAVKTGDVNSNAVTNSLLLTHDRTVGALLFDVEEQQVRSGDEFTVELRPAESIAGYQFTLFHPGLQVVDVRPGGGMNADNFGIFPNEQALTASFFTNGVAGGFAVTFRAVSSGSLSQMLSVSSRITKAEAYRSDAVNPAGTAAELLDVALRFNTDGAATVAGVGFELYQNQPNPWTNRTRVGFHLPESAEATLTVYDEAGRVLYTHSGAFSRGYNSVSIENTALSNASGLLFYRLDTPTNSAARRMVKM
ncbi:MAG: HYR domain-containing protein [Lewinellaceae bacterium]|nr:HYR domain-containing protein [Lewinellaceae bacterium]